jgi:hypothetical protein
VDELSLLIGGSVNVRRAFVSAAAFEVKGTE